jgi:Zinc-binding dehydrogenase
MQRVITIAVTGTWQEYVVADAGRVLPVPAGMSDSTAAQILGNPLTAVILTGDELDVRPGEWLLQTAAGSTVGQSVIQLGVHVGFKTLNVVRRRSAVTDILALGGTAVICTEDEDLRERVADIAGHDGVSKAIDCVSGQVGADVARALAPHGELIVYGALSTHRQTDPDKLTIPIFARSLIYETKTVRGFGCSAGSPRLHRIGWSQRSTGRCSSPRAARYVYRRASRSNSKTSAKPSTWQKHPSTGANRCWSLKHKGPAAVSMLRSCLVGGIAGTRHGRLRHVTTERLGAVMFSSAHLPSQLVALAAIWHPRNELTVW